MAAIMPINALLLVGVEMRRVVIRLNKLEKDYVRDAQGIGQDVPIPDIVHEQDDLGVVNSGLGVIEVNMVVIVDGSDVEELLLLIRSRLLVIPLVSLNTLDHFKGKVVDRKIVITLIALPV